MENMCRLCLENKHLIDVFNLSDCDLLSEMIFATSGVLVSTIFQNLGQFALIFLKLLKEK